MAPSLYVTEMPGVVRSIILESIPEGTGAETGNVSTAHHQNRSPADVNRLTAESKDGLYANLAAGMELRQLRYFVTLPERSTHHVALTASGVVFLVEARQILAHVDRAAQAARAMSKRLGWLTTADQTAH